MNAEEARTRIAAAMARYHNHDPVSAGVVGLTLIAATVWRGVVYLCVGFGVCSLAGWSRWWGLPLAIVVGNTAGWAWKCARRRSNVETLERLAEAAEAKARAASAAEEQ